MRYVAVVTENDEETRMLIPLGTMLEFPKAHDGKTVNQMIADEAEPYDWHPWLAWNARKRRSGETREFEAWCEEIDWCEIVNDVVVADPSGGEASQTGASSPASSPAAPVPGLSSSSSTRSSSTPSGTTSAES